MRGTRAATTVYRTLRRHGLGTRRERPPPWASFRFDCFYIGARKGVGCVWQITARDAFSSCGLAWVFVGEPTAAVAARFLRHHVAPHFRRAGCP